MDLKNTLAAARFIAFVKEETDLDDGYDKALAEAVVWYRLQMWGRVLSRDLAIWSLRRFYAALEEGDLPHDVLNHAYPMLLELSQRPPHTEPPN